MIPKMFQDEESKEFYRKIGFNELEHDYDICMEYKKKINYIFFNLTYKKKML